jgi:hypothetical protein
LQERAGDGSRCAAALVDRRIRLRERPVVHGPPYPDADAARLDAGGESYVLARAVSASGARYETGGVEFWQHQGEATLTGAAGGPYEGCRSELYDTFSQSRELSFRPR